jgi:hypothetical protein
MKKSILLCVTAILAASFLGACANGTRMSSNVGTRNGGADQANGAPVPGGGGQLSEDPSGSGGDVGQGLTVARARQ